MIVFHTISPPWRAFQTQSPFEKFTLPQNSMQPQLPYTVTMVPVVCDNMGVPVAVVPQQRFPQFAQVPGAGWQLPQFAQAPLALAQFQQLQQLQQIQRVQQLVQAQQIAQLVQVQQAQQAQQARARPQARQDEDLIGFVGGPEKDKPRVPAAFAGGKRRLRTRSGALPPARPDVSVGQISGSPAAPFSPRGCGRRRACEALPADIRC